MAKHAAGEAPWQRSVPESHARPASQSEAASRAELSGGFCAPRAMSQAAHAGAGTMPSAAAVPRKNMMPASVAKARECEHCVEPPSVAYAEHAEGLARMMSMPTVLSGEVAGRKRSGTASVTLSTAGKAMTAEGATAASVDVFEVHARVALTIGPGNDARSGGGVARQLPMSAAVAFGASQHLQEEQVGICSAEEEQQQPPAHKFV